MNETGERQTACRPLPEFSSAGGRLSPLFAVGGLYSTANGVAWIMRDLAAALGRLGAPVRVCAAECIGRPSVGDIFERPTRWVAAPGRWLGGLSVAPRLKPILEREIAAADVVHNHSVWMLPNSYASRIAARLKKPVVFTAHGTLEPWALSHSAWKKRLAGWAFQNRDLERAACVHVNSHAEALGIRAYGLRQPVAVIPNGVNDAFLGPLPERRRFERAFPAVAGRRILLFMGRLHRKKGLEPLLRAWARLAPRFDDWVLAIAGPDAGFEADVRRLIQQLGLTGAAVLTGSLEGEGRLEALGAADAFVLPSFSEGFSMAVLEAMAAGLPVLLTAGCNFAEAVDRNAAIEAECSIDGVEAALRRMLSFGDDELARMGRSAKALVAAGYTWPRVAQQTLRLYSWLVGRGPRPEFILEE